MDAPQRVPTWTLAAALGLALALRLPWLGAMPTPSGDEGNWTWIAYDLSLGRPAALPPDARFVSLAFARMIAASYQVFGASFAAARGVLVAGLAAGLAASWVLARRMGLGRAGAAVAFGLAAHPWAVLWSRTCTVPYALSLALAVAGPLAWLDALRTRSPWRMLLASQLLGLGMHFSPLALVPIAACALASFGPERPRGWSLAASVTGLAHVVPMLAAARAVATAASGRPRSYFTEFPRRVYVYLRAVLGSLDGEATLRHFTGTEAGIVTELGLAALTAGVVVYALRARDDDPPPLRALVRYARLHTALALVGLPLVLAPARPWNLPAIDAERYGFVAVAPFLLALGALAARAGRARLVAWSVVAWLALVPTARAGHFFLRGGSPDRGFYTLAGGGGYRGWKVPREREALPVLLRREVDRLRGGARATLVVADYAFHPLHFVNASGGSPTVDILKFALPARPGELHAFVVWSDGLFAPGFTPRDWIDGNERLRALMRSEDFEGLRRVRVFTQPDGAPLCELWAARRVARGR